MPRRGMLEPARDILPRHWNGNSSWRHPGGTATTSAESAGRSFASVAISSSCDRLSGSRAANSVERIHRRGVQASGRILTWRINRERAAAMATVEIAILLLGIAAITAAPLAKVHVKFVSPPHIYEHGITTDGDRTVSQRSFVSIGRRSTVKSPKEFGERIHPGNRHGVVFIKPENAESLWPVGVFLPPININDLGYSWQDSGHMTPDFSNGLEYHDPYLLTGEDAMLAVKYLFGHGELFYNDFPHDRALLRNQEERRQNGLHGHLLSSLRPTSPFYRKAQN